jgi:hypothetical protein
MDEIFRVYLGWGILQVEKHEKGKDVCRGQSYGKKGLKKGPNMALKYLFWSTLPRWTP